jgi:hypothetical protein
MEDAYWRASVKAETSLTDRHDNGKAWLYEVETYTFHVGTLECPPLAPQIY